jgi:hypothetical protein
MSLEAVHMSRKHVHMSRNFLDRGVGGENLFFPIVSQMGFHGSANRVISLSPRSVELDGRVTLSRTTAPSSWYRLQKYVYSSGLETASVSITAVSSSSIETKSLGTPCTSAAYTAYLSGEMIPLSTKCSTKSELGMML